MKYEAFIGRWQPPHKGHQWLISQKLKEGCPILIMVRDIPPDEKNPFTTEQTVEMLSKIYEDEEVVVMAIPDITGVNYGRGVGYAITEHVPPDDIERISATQIRNCINNDDDSWKKLVDEKAHDIVVKYLKNEEGN